MKTQRPIFVEQCVMFARHSINLASMPPVSRCCVPARKSFRHSKSLSSQRRLYTPAGTPRRLLHHPFIDLSVKGGAPRQMEGKIEHFVLRNGTRISVEAAIPIRSCLWRIHDNWRYRLQRLWAMKARSASASTGARRARRRCGRSSLCASKAIVRR